jgi:hypothetical protein
MSWDIEIPIIVRTLINDLSDQPSYSDERLKQIIAVAAKYVQFDVVLDYSYNVDVVEGNISPDPTDHNDEIFISLVSLKAACIVDQSALRTKAALEGIRASLGSATLTVKGSLEGFIKILEKGPCASYDELTSHWDVSQATAVRAVLGPFVGNKFDPRSLLYNNKWRDLY